MSTLVAIERGDSTEREVVSLGDEHSYLPTVADASACLVDLGDAHSRDKVDHVISECQRVLRPAGRLNVLTYDNDRGGTLTAPPWAQVFLSLTSRNFAQVTICWLDHGVVSLKARTQTVAEG